MNQNIPTSSTCHAAQPEKSSPITSGLAVLAVAAAASLVIPWKLADEPFFIDESAMIAQSYYYTLFKTGQWQHPDWLHYAAYDHPPLPKYFFGLSLDLAGLPVPATLDRWMRWMGFEPGIGGGWRMSPAGSDFSPPADHRVLVCARVPSALFGAAGIVALYVIASQVHSRFAGFVATGLLLFNPLYVTHARRAMSDSFAECLVAASVAVGIWGCKLTWQRDSSWWKWSTLVGSASILCGSAALAKLNGGIATVIVLAMLVTTWLVTFVSKSRVSNELSKANSARFAVPVIAALAIACASFVVFVALNPLMTARPIHTGNSTIQSRRLASMSVFGRAKYLVDFRREWSKDARNNQTFKKDWLRTLPDRVRMTVWEGFGRFSPLGPSDIRTHEPRADEERFADYRRAASIVWLPVVSAGFVWLVRSGWKAVRSGRVPIEWALVWYMLFSLAIVLFMIPLNWDRYYLPLQAPAAALAGIAIAAAVRRIVERAGYRVSNAK